MDLARTSDKKDDRRLVTLLPGSTSDSKHKKKRKQKKRRKNKETMEKETDDKV